MNKTVLNISNTILEILQNLKKLEGQIQQYLDIFVSTNSGKRFYIEAKKSPAQCGQFVLFADYDRHQFKYSVRNEVALNTFSCDIISYMNKNFNIFSSPNTSTIPLQMNQRTFVSWIVDKYSKQNVKFFITGTDSSNFVIFHIKDFSAYFDVSASYRVKKSGSHHLPCKYYRDVSEYISSKYKVEEVYFKNQKMIVSSSMELNKVYFSLNGNNYMFSSSGMPDGIFEVKVLSQTNNANVIFSVNYTGKPGISLPDFENMLK